MPAEPPAGRVENHVTLLKLMFAEEFLPALLGNEQGVDNYWKTINSICAKDFASLLDDCAGVEIEIQKPPFNIKESRASLNEGAIGRGLKCAILPEDRLMVDDWWGQEQWEEFVKAMFAHFRREALSELQWNSFTKADQRFLNTCGHVSKGSNHPPPPHHPSHHPPHLALPPPPSTSTTSASSSSSSSS